MSRLAARRYLKPITARASAPVASPLGAYHYGTSNAVWAPDRRLYHWWGLGSRTWKVTATNTWGTVAHAEGANGVGPGRIPCSPHFFAGAGTLRELYTWFSVPNVLGIELSVGIYSNLSDRQLWPAERLWHTSQPRDGINGWTKWTPDLEMPAGVYWLAYGWNGSGYPTSRPGYLIADHAAESPSMLGDRMLSSFWTLTAAGRAKGASIHGWAPILKSGLAAPLPATMPATDDNDHEIFRTWDDGSRPANPTAAFSFEART
jgi:hypothetical protein